jgi:small-conductance mechanosensitive channel
MEASIKQWSDIIIPWLLHHGIKIVVICIAAYIVNIILRNLIIRTVKVMVVPDANGSKEAEKKREDTLIRIFNGTLKVVILTLTILIILPELGIEIGPILAGAGIVGLAFGFGGQYLIKDLISGLFIILENQYRIGDVVNINSTGGLVEDISLRKTTLRDLDGTVHHIPHGAIIQVANLSKGFARLNLNIGIAYDTDLDHLIEVINRLGQEIAEDPVYKDSILSPPKFLRVDSFGDSSIVVKILGDTKPLKQWEIMGEFRRRMKIAFDKEGIEIPFPQRVVHMPSAKSS